MGGIDLSGLWGGLTSITWQQLVMVAVGGVLMYLAIAKDYEPTLLLPIGFGCMLANLPVSAYVLGPEGLFGILELVKDRETKEPLAPWNSSSPEMNSLKRFCLDNGLFLYTHWHTVLIIPPLIITEAQIKEGMDVLDRALEITDKAIQ